MGFPASTRHIPEYYNDITDSTDYLKMLDFDNRENLKTFERRARLAGTRNFLLDFGYYSAWCGFDLNLNSWIKFLNKQVQLEVPLTRHIITHQCYSDQQSSKHDGCGCRLLSDPA